MPHVPQPLVVPSPRVHPRTGGYLLMLDYMYSIFLDAVKAFDKGVQRQITTLFANKPNEELGKKCGYPLLKD